MNVLSSCLRFSECSTQCMRSLRRPWALGVALLVGLLGGLPLGCGPRQPPKLPVPTVQPVPVPMPAAPPPADAPLFGYLKLRDLSRAISLFGGEATLGPMAQAQGVNLGEIISGKPLSLFIWDPDRVDTPFALPLLGLFPVPAAGTIASRLTSMNSSLTAEPWGELTAIGMNPRALDQARGQKEALLGIAGADTPFDALLYLHVDAMMSKYAPVLRQGIRAMLPMLALSAVRQPGAPSAASTVAMLEGVVSSLESVRAVAVGARPYDGGVELSALVQDKAARPGEKGPIAAPNLLQFLPPGDVNLVWNSRDLQRIVDFYMRLYGPMLDEQPQLRTIITGLVDEWMKIGRKSEMAITMSLGGERAFRLQGILRVDNPAALVALGRKTATMFATGPLHDAYKRLGVDMQISSKQGVRKVQGWPVDRYEYKLVMPDARQGQPTAMNRQIFEKLGGASYEMAQVGPYILYAMNAPLDPVVASLFKGPGKASISPSTALAAFPPGGTLYADVNVSSLLKGLASLMPPEAAARMPSLPPEVGALSFFGYDGGEVSYYKTRIPMTLILAIKTAADQLRMPGGSLGGPYVRPGAPPP
jgi:hypothetical protein